MGANSLKKKLMANYYHLTALLGPLVLSTDPKLIIKLRATQEEEGNDAFLIILYFLFSSHQFLFRRV